MIGSYHRVELAGERSGEHGVGGDGSVGAWGAAGTMESWKSRTHEIYWPAGNQVYIQRAPREDPKSLDMLTVQLPDKITQSMLFPVATALPREFLVLFGAFNIMHQGSMNRELFCDQMGWEPLTP